MIFLIKFEAQINTKIFLNYLLRFVIYFYFIIIFILLFQHFIFIVSWKKKIIEIKINIEMKKLLLIIN